jgi:formiminoglutamase
LSLHSDSNWPRASAWLSGEHVDHPLGRLAVLGAPLNRSITPGRCDLGPTSIRNALERLSTYDLDHRVDLRSLRVDDLGDLPLAKSSPEEALVPLRGGVESALEEAEAVVLLGGDNGITRPGCHGLGVSLERVGRLTLDAHLDLRDTAGRLMNGNPVRALLEDGLPGNQIVQIGLQPFANSKEYADVARRHHLQGVSADEVQVRGIERVVEEALVELSKTVDAIYVDLDLDVMDRAFAPGCPGARPGGLMPWQVRRFAHLVGRHPKVRAMDLVELDPERDRNDDTALAAATFLLAFASGLVRRLENAR